MRSPFWVIPPRKSYSLVVRKKDAKNSRLHARNMVERTCSSAHSRAGRLTDLGNSTAGLDKDAGSGANQTIQSLLHHQEWAALGGLVKVLERFRLQSAVDVRGYQALRIAASVVSMSAKESIVRDQSLQALL